VIAAHNPPVRNTLTGRFKSKLTDNSASDNVYSDTNLGTMSGGEPDLSSAAKTVGLSLRLVERKGDLVAPKLQVTSPEGHHDNEAFAVRVNTTDYGNPRSDKFQVISVSTFSEIRIMTLN